MLFEVGRSLSGIPFESELVHMYIVSTAWGLRKSSVRFRGGIQANGEAWAGMPGL